MGILLSLYKSAIRNKNKILCVVFALTMTVSAPMSVFALSEDDLDFFAQNGFIYYNPDQGSTSSNGDCLDLNPISQNSTFTVIGDSISDADVAKEAYKKLLGEEKVTFYTKVGAPWAWGDAIVKNKETILGDVVIFALGTNNFTLKPNDQESGGVSAETIYETANAIGDNKTIVFVTNYGTDEKMNSYIKTNENLKAVARKKTNVRIADWAEIAKEKIAKEKIKSTKIIAEDTFNVHPSVEGYKFFIEAIKQALGGAAGLTDPTNISLENATYYYRDQNGKIETKKIFSKEHRKTLRNNMHIYKEVAERNGIPWQMLAAIHYKEHNLEMTWPDDGDGPYQILHSDKKTSGTISAEEFKSETERAAKLLKDKEKEHKFTINEGDEKTIKKAFFVYNGKYSSYMEQAKNLGYSDEDAMIGEGSLYVMNGYDEKRAAGFPTPNWRILIGGKFVDKPHYPVGTYVAYLALKGVAPGENCATTEISSTGGLNYEQAINFAMNYGANKGGLGSRLMGEAWEYCGGSGSNCVTLSAFFVRAFTKYRYEPKYGNGKDVVDKFMYQNRNKKLIKDNHPAPFSILSAIGGPDSDVDSKYGHTAIVIGATDKEYLVAHAGCGRREHGQGDGTVKGRGSAFISREAKSKQVSEWLWLRKVKKYIFVHLDPDEIKMDELMNFIKQGAN